MFGRKDREPRLEAGVRAVAKGAERVLSVRSSAAGAAICGSGRRRDGQLNEAPNSLNGRFRLASDRWNESDQKTTSNIRLAMMPSTNGTADVNDRRYGRPTVGLRSVDHFGHRPCGFQ